VAELLLDKEVIFADDIEKILGPKVTKETIASANEKATDE
jgi:hypothetical protein